MLRIRPALHVFLLALTLLPPPAFAKKTVLSKAIDLRKLELKYSSVESFEAEFTQEVYQATLARTKSSKGALMLSKPKLVRWETHAPEKTVLVSNGIKVWYYTPKAGGDEKGQVVVRSAAELASNALLGILNGTISIDKEFTLKDTKQSEETTGLTLVPKKKMGDIAEVVLEVDDKYLIREVKLNHTSGNRTKITLQNIRLGAKLPTNLFKFSPPPGTNIVTGP